MGIFDYVFGVEVDCPKCGRKLREFQSKDGECCLGHLDYRQVLNFYTPCDCGQWIEYQRKPARDLSDFDKIDEEVKPKER